MFGRLRTLVAALGRTLPRNGRRTVSRYDLILAVIPSAFVLAVLLGHLLSLSPRTATVVASIVGAMALADALFVHPPGAGER